MTPRPAICVTKRDRKPESQQDCRRWSPPDGCCYMTASSPPTACRTFSLVHPGSCWSTPTTPESTPHLRYHLRRTRASAHSLLAWALALVVLRARPLAGPQCRHTVTQIQPTAPSQDTAAWARQELATQLGHRRALDSWSVIVYTYYAVLNRAPDRRFTAGHRLGHGDTGTTLRATLDTGLPAGLHRAAIAFLATEVVDTCPPA